MVGLWVSRIDGDPRDMREKVSAVELSDPRGDAKADSHYNDIRTLYAGVRKRKLYFALDFHNDISKNKMQTVTFHIRFRRKKINYWLQYNGLNLAWVAVFKDGTRFKKWTNISRREQVSAILLDYARALEVEVPLDVLKEGRAAVGLEVRAIIGGDRGGKAHWYYDHTGFLYDHTGFLKVSPR